MTSANLLVDSCLLTHPAVKQRLFFFYLESCFRPHDGSKFCICSFLARFGFYTVLGEISRFLAAPGNPPVISSLCLSCIQCKTVAFCISAENRAMLCLIMVKYYSKAAGQILTLCDYLQRVFNFLQAHHQNQFHTSHQALVHWQNLQSLHYVCAKTPTLPELQPLPPTSTFKTKVISVAEDLRAACLRGCEHVYILYIALHLQRHKAVFVHISSATSRPCGVCHKSSQNTQLAFCF